MQKKPLLWCDTYKLDFIFFQLTTISIHYIISTWSLWNTITNYFSIAQIHEWIQIEFLDDHSSFVIYIIILKFRGVCCNLLVWNMSFKPPVNSIRSNLTHLAFIRSVFTAFSGKRWNLKTKFLISFQNYILQ